MQLGDVKTSSDITLLKSLIDFTPNTSIKTGISKFVIGLDYTMAIQKIRLLELLVSVM